MTKFSQNIERIICDADDTLWENNVFYVNATSSFFDLVHEYGFPRDDVELRFDELELKVVQERGYGSHNFVYILEELYSYYNNTSNKKINRQRFEKIIERFTSHPTSKPLLFENVSNTLAQLKKRYDMYILTKGDFKEQEGKILRSGLIENVNKFFIVPEKDDQTYLDLLDQYGWSADSTCMVGNSPKSDINPALRIGMYAVYIPYRDTWKLDNEEIINANGRLLTLDKFSDLLTVF